MKKTSTIGKYEILEKIGEGGFGIVYRGRDPMLDREVAIKVLRADLASSPGFVERFRREARLAASLRHPNIVGIIEVGEHESRYYLVMEYLSGQPLDQLLEEGKPLSLTRAVELLHPLADALDYAHSKSVIHRDIKPANVIFTEDGKRPVLTDFGLVKSTVQEGITTTGVILGTAEYMSPEQVLGKEVSPATDIYALGVIAFQMLTGVVPYKSAAPFEVQNAHVNQPPPDPRKYNPGLSPDITEILMRALEKDPTRRFNSAGELIQMLEQISIRFNEQQVMQIYKVARQQMENHKFDDAITQLEQIQAILPKPEVSSLLDECRKRKDIYEEIQGLTRQRREIEDKLQKYASSKSGVWIPARVDDLTSASIIFDIFLLIFTIVSIASLVVTAITLPIDWTLFPFLISFVLLCTVFFIEFIFLVVILDWITSSRLGSPTKSQVAESGNKSLEEAKT